MKLTSDTHVQMIWESRVQTITEVVEDYDYVTHNEGFEIRFAFHVMKPFDPSPQSVYESFLDGLDGSHMWFWGEGERLQDHLSEEADAALHQAARLVQRDLQSSSMRLWEPSSEKLSRVLADFRSIVLAAQEDSA